jgi:hypothetical protein
MMTDNLTIRKYCDTATSTTFNVKELAAVTFAEAGAWNYVNTVAVDGVVLDSFDGLFGNTMYSAGVDGYTWLGTSITVAFETSMPIIAFVTHPSIPTQAETFTVNYDSDVDFVHDFEMSPYPNYSVHTDFGEIETQTVTITATDSRDRFLGGFGVISPCNSLDSSYWMFVDFEETTCPTNTEGVRDCGEEDYDLNINEGIFAVPFPSVFMEAYDLSPESCFETFYTLLNDDGTAYTGPLYVSEGVLTLDNPYDYVGQTLGGKVQISK